MTLILTGGSKGGAFGVFKGYVVLLHWFYDSNFYKIYHFRLIFHIFFSLLNLYIYQNFQEIDPKWHCDKSWVKSKNCVQNSTDYFRKWDKTASLAWVWREFDASLMRVWSSLRWCEFGASLVRVWREFGASLVRVWLMRVWCKDDARSMRAWCAFARRLVVMLM